MACLCIGAVTVGIYPTLTPAQARELLVLSGARIVFVEDHAKQVALQEATRDLDPPVRFVTFEREAGPDVMTLAELRRRVPRQRAGSVGPERSTGLVLPSVPQRRRRRGRC